MPIPEIPNRFLCPITLDIMFDPVLAADGRNYERSAIERWLREHNNTSPFTREIINNRLTQNMDLRAETLEFLDLNAHYIHEAIVTLTTQNNHASFIKALIKRNKDNLNRKDEAGQTPLHIAVINRKTEVIDTDSNINIIQLLLREGANYKIRNNQHRTSKKEAKELEFWDVVDLIDNYLMRDTNQMDLNELRLTTTAIQQQELQTEDAVVRLTDRMQRLTVNQPRFLKFFSWQAMELLALGVGVAGIAVAQRQRNINTTLTTQYQALQQRTTKLERDKTTMQNQITGIINGTVNPPSEIWGLGAGNTIWRFLGDQKGWEQIEGNLLQISSGNGETWGIGAKNTIYRYKGKKGEGWEEIKGNLRQVVVGSKNPKSYSLTTGETYNQIKTDEDYIDDEKTVEDKLIEIAQRSTDAGILFDIQEHNNCHTLCGDIVLKRLSTIRDNPVRVKYSLN